MEIVKRIWYSIKANINHFLDNNENVEANLKQQIHEMEESLSKVTVYMAKSMASVSSLSRRVQSEKDSIVEWENHAKEALISNREDLAKKALEKKLFAVKNIQNLEKNLTVSRTTLESIQKTHQRLKDELEQAIRNKNILIARHNAAVVDRDLKKALSGLGRSPFGDFEDMENKVDQAEAEAEAYGSLSSDISLKEEIESLSSADVEEELSKLKKEL